MLSSFHSGKKKKGERITFNSQTQHYRKYFQVKWNLSHFDAFFLAKLYAKREAIKGLTGFRRLESVFSIYLAIIRRIREMVSNYLV